MKTIAAHDELAELDRDALVEEVLAAHRAFRNLSSAIEAQGFEIWHDVDKRNFELRQRRPKSSPASEAAIDKAAQKYSGALKRRADR